MYLYKPETVAFMTRSPDVSKSICIVGAGRSGTTWLAKIFDSHPGVLYRHEPDVIAPPPPALEDGALESLLRQWAGNTALRASGKRPQFPKAWQSPLLGFVRGLLVLGLLAAGSIEALRGAMERLPLWEPGDPRRARFVFKTVDWRDGVVRLARALPNARVVLLLRSPQAQVASVLRGLSRGRFGLREGLPLPIDLPGTLRTAAAHGIDAEAFAALPPAAQLAWNWLSFNDALHRDLAELPNVRVVIYRDLCADPVGRARDLFAFAGLNWTGQTERFVRSSAQGRGDAPYYSVFQDSSVTLNRWRGQLPREDVELIWRIASISPLARYWPELACV